MALDSFVFSNWKVAEVVMIPKPGKSATEAISLLPILSKLYEKIFQVRIKRIIEKGNLIPKHQFGFRNAHATIDHVRCITDVIERALKEKNVCTAVLLYFLQAFDKSAIRVYS